MSIANRSARRFRPWNQAISVKWGESCWHCRSSLALGWYQARPFRRTGTAIAITGATRIAITGATATATIVVIRTAIAIIVATISMVAAAVTGATAIMVIRVR